MGGTHVATAASTVSVSNTNRQQRHKPKDPDDGSHVETVTGAENTVDAKDNNEEATDQDQDMEPHEGGSLSGKDLDVTKDAPTADAPSSSDGIRLADTFLNRQEWKRALMDVTSQLRTLSQEIQELPQIGKDVEQNYTRVRQQAELAKQDTVAVEERHERAKAALTEAEETLKRAQRQHATAEEALGNAMQEKERFQQYRREKEEEYKARKAELTRLRENLKQGMESEIARAVTKLDQGIGKDDPELFARLYPAMKTFACETIRQLYEPSAIEQEESSSRERRHIEKAKEFFRSNFADFPELAASMEEHLSEFVRSHYENKRGEEGSDDENVCEEAGSVDGN
jgi:DNA repair exonuclease SbcCD ATPase subunit